MSGPGPAVTGSMTRNTSTVTVTDVHLKAGAAWSGGWCPAALALREEVQADPLADEVEVTAGWVRVALRHGSWYAETTGELAGFMAEFDATAGDDGEGQDVPDPGKLQALLEKASAGLLSFPLTWHEGDPPGYDEDGEGDG